jgi:hypothetical protein
MKKWLFLLRPENGLFFWQIFTPAGNLVCRSVHGFLSEDEAKRDLERFHPPDHF